MTPEGSFVGFIGTGTDITEQKENHERVIFLNKELSESIKTRDKFFSIIAHDIRSPLSGLIGITEILEEDFHEMNDREMLDMLTEANKSARSLFNLTENLLEWSRIQTGRIKFEPVKIYLRSLFHDLSLLYQQNLKYKNITLIYPTNTSILINADDRMTYTVIRNLISNAIKFTPQGGTITIDVAEENDFVKIFFRDTGVGMDENEMSKLFKVDSGFSLPGTENERGTGLGLVLCKDLVERQGGKIGVESVKGKGTVFYFTLQAFKE
jgi:signal transduction histidine kinase